MAFYLQPSYFTLFLLHALCWLFADSKFVLLFDNMYDNMDCGRFV